MMSRPQAKLIFEECLCLAVLKAARRMSVIYDDALRPHGLTNSQFTLLSFLKLKPLVGVATLAHRLQMERTTGLRNIQLLETAGLVETEEAAHRTVLARLSAAGEATVARAFQSWHLAQLQAAHSTGHQNWTRLLGASFEIVSACEGQEPFRVSTHHFPQPRPTMKAKATKELVGAELEILRTQLCMCTTLRRCARSASRHYEAHMPRALTITQFHILASIVKFPDYRLADYVSVLRADQATLTRAIQKLIGRGLVLSDKRVPGWRTYRLTKQGYFLLESAMAGWNEAQNIVSSRLGNAAEVRRLMHETADQISGYGETCSDSSPG
jgi:DNA-binding MarR family transcriptional regulator